MNKPSDGIGVLREKKMHESIKHFLEPNHTYHEIRVGRFTADIVNEHGITEIQTRNFRAIKKKLDYFLESRNVKIVYPVSRNKTVYWIDPETGESTNGRKSTKTGSAMDIFKELYWIKQYLKSERLTLSIIIVDSQDYRMQDGWGSSGKRGHTKLDHVPVKIVEIIDIESYEYLIKLLPEALPEEFTSAGLMKAAKISRKDAQMALNTLFELELVKRTGRKGNAYVYKIIT